MRIGTNDRRSPRRAHGRTILTTLATALAVALLTTACAAQWTPYGTTPSSFGGLRFMVDVAAVPTVRGGSTVEISYSVTYDELSFVRHEGRYRARFEVTAVVYDRDGRQVAGDTWPRAVVLDAYDDTNSRKLAAREVLRVSVPEGRYRLKVELKSLDSRSAGYVERTIDVEALAPGQLLMGTVEFERVETDDETGEASFVPNPSRQYGQENPLVRVIVPTYGDMGTAYRMDVKVETVGGETQLSLSDSLVQTDWLTLQTAEFSALDLEVGDYVARVFTHAPTGGVSEAETRFRVLTSPRSWGEDFEKMLTQVSYVAERRDLEELDAAPEDERDEAWERFWKKYDPSPDTEENEFRDEFLRRLGYANIRFRTVIEGWQTDMGRIYIQYGEPDDVESEPMGGQPYAWEVWYYYGEHTRYTFMDRHGFGDYVLVETTRI